MYLYFQSGVIDYNTVLADVTHFLVFLCLLWNDYVFLASEERIHCEVNLKDHLFWYFEINKIYDIQY